jgi:hypothetical protein
MPNSVLNRAQTEARLAQAEQHVAQGERHITRQRELIAELERDGHDVTAASARDLLRLFEELQIMHVADRDRYRRELTEMLD